MAGSNVNWLDICKKKLALEITMAYLTT